MAFTLADIEKTLSGGSGLTNTIALPGESVSSGVGSGGASDATSTPSTHTNWLNSVEGILSSGEKLASDLFHKGGGGAPPVVTPAVKGKSHLGLYIGIGAGVILIVAVILIARKK